MSLIFVRIDDRLIHGLVVQNWVKSLRITHIIVADDRVANDQMQKTLLFMAVPSCLKISIFTIEESVRRINAGEFKNGNVLLLISTPCDALSLVKNGLVTKSINVGGLHFVPGKKQIFKSISVDNKDIDAFCEINERGVSLELRIIPTDTSVNIMGCIKKWIKTQM